MADTFGSRVLALRLQRGWSQAELANLSGVTSFTISLMERDKHKPREASVYKLAAAFGVPVSELVNKEDIHVPALRRRMLERNTYVLKFEDGLFYVSDDQEPTKEVSAALHFHSQTAALIEAAIVQDLWGEPVEVVRKMDVENG
jgi:transcriptional regulator with XRE-family HTH domain